MTLSDEARAALADVEQIAQELAYAVLLAGKAVQRDYLARGEDLMPNGPAFDRYRWDPIDDD